MTQSIKSFIRHLTGQQRSLRTKKDYQYVLGDLMDFLARSGGQGMDCVTLDTLQDYMEHLRIERAVQSNTVLHNHTVIMQWLKFLRIREQCPLTGTNFLLFEQEHPKVRKRKAEVDWNGLEKMLDELIDQRAPGAKDNAPVWWRRHALYALFFSTALRISELQALNRDAFRRNAERIVIIGKGDRAREVLISEQARYFIAGYLGARDDTDVALFVRHDEHPATPKSIRLSTNAIQKMMKHDREYYDIVGLTPHKIRHLAAKRLIDATGDLKMAQIYLGHADIQTTAGIYANMEEEHALAKVMLYHPSFRKKRGQGD